MGCQAWIPCRAVRIPGDSPWEWKAEMAGLRSFCPNGNFLANRRIGCVMIGRCITATFALLVGAALVYAQASAQKQVWKSVEFAIVKFNDEAPKSWSMYHTEKKGVLLVRLWKRYLLVNVKDEEVYEIDPQTVKPAGDNVEWSLADKPSEPLETPEWKTRDIGPMQQVSFRLGKNGLVLQIQIPLKMNGQPMY